MTEVIVPENLWEGSDPGSVANWFYEDGALVQRGDLLCEVMTEKITHEIHSPASGILRIRAPTETIVTKRQVLAVVD
jgi:pyruvate dehydrogenase E2 component (dihydrolipoamide acetyltransferase)